MREIKFRAWDTVKKEMLMAVTLHDLCVLNCGQGIDDKFVMNQFTGLKDKNGKEIYEGDICKILYSGWGRKVDSKDTRTLDEYLWDIAETLLIHHDTNGFYATDRVGGYSQSMEHGSHGFIQIIGNIYENPDLIPKK